MDYNLNNLVKTSECSLKFAQDEGKFSGYGSVFSVKDHKNDIIMPHAYDEVLKSGDPVQVFVNHNWLSGALPIGTWDNLKSDEYGLAGDASLEMRMTGAKDAYYAMKSNLVTGLSVAIVPDVKSIERKNGTNVINNILYLKEISIVTDPANEQARITSVKFSEELERVETIRDFERFLRESGIVSKSMAQAVIAKAKAVFGQGDLDTDNATIIKELRERLDRFKI